MPRIFYVNWFRKSEDGRWLWPGFGENIRVLKWVYQRCSGALESQASPLGGLPRLADLDLQGLDFDPEDLAELFEIRSGDWEEELPRIEEHLLSFGDRLPAALHAELASLRLALSEEKSASLQG